MSILHRQGAPSARQIAPMVGLIFIGVLQAIQTSDPNINSTALLRAAKALDMGTLAALAAAVSTLALAATVITTGMLADRLGRRKVLAAALLLTAVGDLLVLASSDTTIFLLGRILAGIGCGAIFGAAFAYVKHFATGKGGLPGALGIFMAVGGVGAVLFSFVGSMLAGIDWRIAYLLVPIISVICLLLVAFLLPPDDKADRPTGPWDALGQVLLGLGIVGLLFGIAHMSAGFESPLTWGTMAAGIVLLVAFYAWERHYGDKAFFPVALFKWPIFIAAVLIGLTYNLAYGASLLSFTNLFQYKLELTDTRLALAQLPFLIAGIVSALVVGRIRGKGKLSRRGLVLLGTIITGLGFVSKSYLTFFSSLRSAKVLLINTGLPLSWFSAWFNWKSLAEPNSGGRRSATGFLDSSSNFFKASSRAFSRSASFFSASLPLPKCFSKSASRVRKTANGLPFSVSSTITSGTMPLACMDRPLGV